MHRRTTLLAVVGCIVTASLCFAADPNLGTWKLNEAKSKIGAGAPKLTTVVYAMTGDSLKVTVDGVDGEGKPLHSEWTGKYDGKDYPVQGDAIADTRSYQRSNDGTLMFASKNGTKVVNNGRVVVAADGKSRTVTQTGTNANGKKFTVTAVYDKQ
jgi:hypothetical protein